jgi:hypothetical protein
VLVAAGGGVFLGERSWLTTDPTPSLALAHRVSAGNAEKAGINSGKPAFSADASVSEVLDTLTVAGVFLFGLFCRLFLSLFFRRSTFVENPLSDDLLT